MKKMLVLDLDGTLTNSQKEITPCTRAALMRLQEAGHIIALASGRPPEGIRRIADELQLARYGGYVLAFNGARITDWRTGEVVFQQTLDHTYLPALYDAALRYELSLFTYRDKWAISATQVSEYAAFEARINHLTILEVEDFPSYVDFPINKCLYSGDPQAIQTCEEELLARYGGELSIFKSEDFFLEIMAKGIDKAASLQRLVNRLGLAREDVICCGDGYNDISMIHYAGVGVAMANAKPVVKEAADVITGSNDEDGLVPVIEQYVLGETRGM